MHAVYRQSGPYSHDSVHQATLLFGTLQPFHGPLVHGAGYPRVIYVQQSETCHVDPAVTIRLQVQRKQVLPGEEKETRGRRERWMSLCLYARVMEREKARWRFKRQLMFTAFTVLMNNTRILNTKFTRHIQGRMRTEKMSFVL